MPQTLSTFDISQSYQNLEQLLVKKELELNEYEAVLQDLHGCAQEKLDNLSYIYKQFRAKEKTLMQHINDLRERKKRFQNSQARIKELMKILLQSMQKRKVETTENTFCLVQGQAKLQVRDKQKIAADFRETVLKVKKRKALTFYKNNKQVPAGFRVVKGKDFVVIRSR